MYVCMYKYMYASLLLLYIIYTILIHVCVVYCLSFSYHSDNVYYIFETFDVPTGTTIFMSCDQKYNDIHVSL